MTSADDRTRSIWQETVATAHLTPLAADVEADVCIVGAGMAGLSTAYLLVQEGRRVVVLDDGPVAGGETSRTTAHLTCALDYRFHELEAQHSRLVARIAAESHVAAIDTLEAIVRREAIACGFARVDGFLFATTGDGREALERELAAAHRAGLTSVTLVDRAPVAAFDTGPALRFPQQGQFHALEYVNGLVASIKRKGGRLYRAHATDVHGGADAHVSTSRGATVKAAHIVVATNTPVNDRVAVHTKQAAYRTYVIGARLPANTVAPVLLWDTDDPYHYVRLHRMSAASSNRDQGPREWDVLIVGGEDHKTGQDPDPAARFRRLESWTRERFPQAAAPEFCWSGQVLEPVDGLALIGRNPSDDDNVYVATGSSGNGMTYGTIAGVLLRDLIMGRDNPWAEVYDPARKTLGALKRFAEENLNVAVQYTDLLTPGEVSDASALRAGQGAVLRRGLTKVAAYRDGRGTLHERSAICTHLGCVVRWNPLEHTWDCPCHGSRFGTDGHVINGPAVRGLAEAAAED
jgi:glycine/D-amino acid oxidase-like deaminating enzyme/nitrite reductase/ring-hydroxylating ferredoxin subunit